MIDENVMVVLKLGIYGTKKTSIFSSNDLCCSHCAKKVNGYDYLISVDHFIISKKR